MENQILEAISRIKNVSKKRPTFEKLLNHISKTSASNIDSSFVYETIKQLAKNEIDDNFKIIEKTEKGNPNDLTEKEVQILFNDESNETLDGNPTNKISQNIDQTSLISSKETPEDTPIISSLTTPCTSFEKKYPDFSAGMNIIEEKIMAKNHLL